MQFPRTLPRPSESEFPGVGLGKRKCENALSVLLMQILCSERPDWSKGFQNPN